MRRIARSLNNSQYLRAETVGFIGLGNMGGPMALNLARKGGFEVIAFDVNKDSLKKYAKEGLAVCEDVTVLARKANKFVTMLPNSSHVSSVLEGENGLFQKSAKNSLFIDSSTISYHAAIKIYENAKKVNQRYIDAPVSGGVGAATAGTLTFMVGAENKELFQECKNLLQHMGKNIANCEKPGAGSIAKICNNMALGIEMIAVAEAISLGKKLGIDPKVLSSIMNTASGRCWSSEVYNPCPGVLENVPASKGYEGGFACELMLKDLGLAADAAKQASADVPLGNHAKDIYQKLVELGLNRKDFAIVYDVLLNNKLKQ
ncbi:3-hydroxyisobutyrate dehydrogenase (macronuclear) [Tetrahymena thermophila SB210]|uniref:3-hydroxyisobutyrate dehydrogenase n=1 Tax=Tetrahymena thermophila (strain SB210) TaxID=312017 RepID=Q22B54_TETTS|nr:3-hydroxyisobutyrate dehydrogenase [Tetrahymena thermophila SB210]EAR82501.1 3-hydroxyisobutyrate dehydrogenase [Tetrahymena thermophila SB210]|eukprot:XP_001030164.1 3-hydroxyisobutyrate dehydrogenase [Tetrahymena thermophila SB210]